LVEFKGGRSVAPDNKPLTLRQLFETDWPNLPAYYQVTTFEGKLLNSGMVTMSWRLNGDFSSRSKFLSVFFESATPSIDVYMACRGVAEQYHWFIDSADNSIELSFRTPDDSAPTSMKDMVFSKRIFVYHDGPDFSVKQKGEIEALYAKRGLSVQFRDAAYTWSHREDRRALRPNPLVPNSVLLPDARTYPGLQIHTKNIGTGVKKQ
jgi:hypothetical protein